MPHDHVPHVAGGIVALPMRLVHACPPRGPSGPPGANGRNFWPPRGPRRGHGSAGGPKVPVVSYRIAARPPTVSLHGRVGRAQAGGSGLLGKEGDSCLVVLGLGGEVTRGADPGSRVAGARGLPFDRRRPAAALATGPARRAAQQLRAGGAAHLQSLQPYTCMPVRRSMAGASTFRPRSPPHPVVWRHQSRSPSIHARPLAGRRVLPSTHHAP